MARNPVSHGKIWFNFNRVYVSDHGCISENNCRIHLTNFLAFCSSIYDWNVWFQVNFKSNVWQNWFSSKTLNFARSFTSQKQFIFRSAVLSSPKLFLQIVSRRFYDTTYVNKPITNTTVICKNQLTAGKKYKQVICRLRAGPDIKNWDFRQHFQDLSHSFSLYWPPSRQIHIHLSFFFYLSMKYLNPKINCITF